MDEEGKSIDALIAELTGTAQAIFAKCEIPEGKGPTFSRKSLGATLKVISDGAGNQHSIGTEIGCPEPIDLRLTTGGKTVACIKDVSNQPNPDGGRVQGTHEQRITLSDAVDGTSGSDAVTVSWEVDGKKAGESVSTEAEGDGDGERLVAKASTVGVSASYTAVSASCTGISAGVTGMSYSADLFAFDFTLARVLARGVEDCFTLNATKGSVMEQEVKADQISVSDAESRESLSDDEAEAADEEG